MRPADEKRHAGVAQYVECAPVEGIRVATGIVEGRLVGHYASRMQERG